VERTNSYQIVIEWVDRDGQKTVYATMQPLDPELPSSMSVGMEAAGSDSEVSKAAEESVPVAKRSIDVSN